MLATGAIHLTAVRLLSPHLTPANHREVLDSARGKKKPEIEDIVARLSPRPDVPASVRKLPAPRPSAFLPAEAPVAPDESATVPAASEPAAPVPTGTSLTAEPLSVPRAAVSPLSPDRYKLQLTIGGDTLEKLRLAKDMLSHAIPSGDDAAVLDRALTGRCAFVGTNGHRCNERRFVEFHHVDLYALGGEATMDKIELRCRRHNDYESRLYFGKRRRDDTGAVREKAIAQGPQPFDPASLFQNKLAGGASPATRFAGVEPQR